MDADTKEYSVQRVVNVRTVPMWGFLVTEVKRTCANSSRRRVGNKGGKAKMNKDRNQERERERGELGTTKGGVPRHSRVTGGGGGWNYGVGIWFK